MLLDIRAGHIAVFFIYIQQPNNYLKKMVIKHVINNLRLKQWVPIT